MTTNNIKFGTFLISIGIIGLLISSIMNIGSVIAISFAITSIGFLFQFPNLLEEDTDEFSLMRFIVFCIVMMFCIGYLKSMWYNPNFIIDENWKYILGLAFSGKVIQKFAENKQPKK